MKLFFDEDIKDHVIYPFYVIGPEKISFIVLDLIAVYESRHIEGESSFSDNSMLFKKITIVTSFVKIDTSMIGLNKRWHRIGPGGQRSHNDSICYHSKHNKVLGLRRISIFKLKRIKIQDLTGKEHL